MSIYSIHPITLGAVHTYPLASRKSKVSIRDFAKPPGANTSLSKFLDSLPNILAAEDLRHLLSAIHRARKQHKAMLWGLGGHVIKVGLGYVTLGQSATTLSGGEAQRIKLARELSKRQTGRTLYILDEPTTGLHFDDVRKLLDVLQRLVSLGNTVLIIEHHLDVIKQADWVIDLGPEGGEGGGRIVAQGPPEQVARTKKSYTGQALARVLGLSPNGHSPSAAK